MGKNVFICIGFAFLGLAGGSFLYPAKAYAPYPTHFRLSERAVELYDMYDYSRSLTSQEKSWIAFGSAHEDSPVTRVVHHFYDPINNMGLQGFISSKLWAHDDGLQSLNRFQIGGQAGVFTWEEAIAAYNAGDKERAYKTLGHILHLIQDATVPAHTRQDAHPPVLDEEFGGPDPYEHATEDMLAPSMGELEPVYLRSLDAYFDAIAFYTNTNFLSQDSIGFYEKPLPTRIDSKYIYAKDVGGSEYHLAMVNGGLSNLFNENPTEYDLSDPFVIEDYWSRLSPKAIQYGAGVIRLFHESVNQEPTPEQSQTTSGNFLQTLANAVQSTGSFIADTGAHIWNGARSASEALAFGFANLVPDPTTIGVELGFDLNLSFLPPFIAPSIGIDEITWQRQIEVQRQEAQEKFAIQLSAPAQDYQMAPEEFMRQRTTLAQQTTDNIQQTTGNERDLSPRGGTDPATPDIGVGGQPATDQPQEGERAKVKRVIDGDTIILASGEYVRYIGVDAPEPQSPYRKIAECYAEEAKQRNAQLVFNQEVLLFSKPDENTDDYGRLLRYVWVGTKHINNQLIAEGYAYSYNFGHPHPYDQQFEESEQNAKQEKLGLWSACASAQEARVIEEPSVQEEQQDPDAEEASQDAEASSILPLQINRDLVINEVRMQNGEFMELYNPTSTPTPLAGYYFAYYPKTRTLWDDPYRAKAFPNDAVIPARGVFLITFGDGPSEPSAISAAWQAYASDTLANSAGTVALFAGNPSKGVSTTLANDPAGAIRLDAFGWGSVTLAEGTSFSESLKDNESAARNPNRADIDNDNNSFDFALTSWPTPGMENQIVPRKQDPLIIAPSASITPAQIVISEVAVNGAEFVELYNPTQQAQLLDGHYLAYYSSTKTVWNDALSSKTFPQGTQIPPGQYFVIALNDYETAQNYPVPDWTPESFSQLSNSAGTIAIFPFDPETKSAEVTQAGLIDAAGWGTAQLAEPTTAPAPAEVPGAAKSIARDYQNSDTDNNVADFAVGAPTPGVSTPEQQEEPPPQEEEPAPLQLVINEIQATDNEFVELYNIGSQDAALSGFYLAYYASTKTVLNDPSLKWQFSEGLVIPAQSYFLIGVKGYPETAGNPNADWQLLTQAGALYTTGQLSNDNGAIALFSEDPTCAGQIPCEILPLDLVAWGIDAQITLKETQTAAKPAVNKSISRNAGHTDTNNNADDFVTGNITPINSAGSAYSYAAAGLYSGSVGYFCPPYTSSLAPQGEYTLSPGLFSCTYSGTNLWQGGKYGDLYTGTPGNAQIVAGHSLGNAANPKTFFVTQMDNYTTVPSGPMFFAIYEGSSTSLINAFRAAFQAGSLPPSNKYGILEWILAP